MDTQELDRKVAEALGWKTSKIFRGAYWIDSKDDVQRLKSAFTPSTNGQQAIDLQKQFDIATYPNSKTKIWTARLENQRGAQGECGPTPEIAICKAVIAAHTDTQEAVHVD